MSKRFGQIDYEIPKCNCLIVSIDEKQPFVIADNDVVEPLISIRDGDFIIKLDPSKRI